MDLRALLIDVAAKAVDVAGSVVTYKPVVGDEREFKAIVEFDVLLQPGGVDAQTWPTGTVITTAWKFILQVPRKGDVFEMGAEQFTVTQLLLNDGYRVRVQVV